MRRLIGVSAARVQAGLQRGAIPVHRRQLIGRGSRASSVLVALASQYGGPGGLLSTR